MNASTAGRDHGGSPATRPGASGWQRWLVPGLVLLALLLLAAWAAVKFTTPGKRAELGAGYIAHVVCSCRYVGNRDMASCMTDFETGTEIVSVADDTERREITASVPLLARRTATYDPEYGCALDRP